MAELLSSVHSAVGTRTKQCDDRHHVGANHVGANNHQIGQAADKWQQMTDEASGKPYWSLTRCVLSDDRARLPRHSCRCLPAPVPRPPRTRSSFACRQHVTRAVRVQQAQRKDRPVFMDPTRSSAQPNCGRRGRADRNDDRGEADRNDDRGECGCGANGACDCGGGDGGADRGSGRV
jgi:hypothetical protein